MVCKTTRKSKAQAVSTLSQDNIYLLAEDKARMKSQELQTLQNREITGNNLK